VRSTQLTLGGVRPEIAAGDSDSWCTPEWIVELVRACFDGVIDLDPCSNAGSIVYARINWTLEHNGDRPWGPRKVYVNGPYSNPDWWMARSAECLRSGGEVIALPKLDPSTKWWRHTRSAAAMCLLNRRVRFDRPDGAPAGASNFPSALVLWSTDQRRVEGFSKLWAPHGDVWTR